MSTHLTYEVNNESPAERKRFVKGLFDSIVPTYDLLNRLLSLGRDMRWRRDLVQKTAVSRGDRVIDLCCGTGDVSRLLSAAGAATVSLDFSPEMLARGRRRKALTGHTTLGDACTLPFPDNTFEAATIAFGIRNLPDLDRFMSETYRVLDPGGRLAILELTRPKNRFIQAVYSFYLRKLLPTIGGIMSGRPLAYRYLSRTIDTFVHPVTLRQMLEAHGFASVTEFPRTFGVATIMVCRKEPV